MQQYFPVIGECRVLSLSRNKILHFASARTQEWRREAGTTQRRRWRRDAFQLHAAGSHSERHDDQGQETFHISTGRNRLFVRNP